MKTFLLGNSHSKNKDLENEDIEIVTPEIFLATLNEDANLKFSIIIHKGIGYVPSEEIREDLPEGYIPIDAFFTPVKKRGGTSVCLAPPITFVARALNVTDDEIDTSYVNNATNFDQDDF